MRYIERFLKSGDDFSTLFFKALVEPFAFLLGVGLSCWLLIVGLKKTMSLPFPFFKTVNELGGLSDALGIFIPIAIVTFATLSAELARRNRRNAKLVSSLKGTTTCLIVLFLLLASTVALISAYIQTLRIEETVSQQKLNDLTIMCMLNQMTAFTSVLLMTYRNLYFELVTAKLLGELDKTTGS